MKMLFFVSERFRFRSTNKNRAQLQLSGSPNGIDCCRVGYLPKAYVKNWKQYDELLVQVIEVYSAECDSPTKRQKFHRNHGLAVAVDISSAEPSSPVAKKQKTSSPYIKIA